MKYRVYTRYGRVLVHLLLVHLLHWQSLQSLIVSDTEAHVDTHTHNGDYAEW